MFNKAIKEIESLLTLIGNPQLASYVAGMCADIINQEMSGKINQQDCLYSLEAVFLGLQKRYEQFNK